MLRRDAANSKRGGQSSQFNLFYSVKWMKNLFLETYFITLLLKLAKKEKIFKRGDLQMCIMYFEN